MSDTEMRAAFEAWAASQGYEVEYLPVVKQYDDASTHAAWLAWQAAQRAAPAPSDTDIDSAIWHLKGKPEDFDMARRLIRRVFAAPSERQPTTPTWDEKGDVCLTCGHKWDEHDFGVPSPYCP